MRSLHQLVVVILHCRFMHLGHEIGCNDDDDGDDGRLKKKKRHKKRSCTFSAGTNCVNCMLVLLSAKRHSVGRGCRSIQQ